MSIASNSMTLQLERAATSPIIYQFLPAPQPDPPFSELASEGKVKLSHTAMDELLASLASFGSPPSMAGDGNTLLEFETCEVPEQWLLDEDGGSNGSAGTDLSGMPPARRRGRKHGPRADGPALTHVEAEQQRRDRLNRRFCDLRAVVPTVSGMDRASLLADATSYITQVRGRVEQLEAEVKQAVAGKGELSAANATTAASHSFGGGQLEEALEVRMLAGRDAAALRLTTAARHAPARFMAALRSLDLPVQHAGVCRVGGFTVQDAVVDVPAAALRDEGCLRAALLRRLQQSG
ncbi:hypothetical protein ACP70R_000396 [Stipagrostis hirtigluma subsp. patula]